MWTDNDDDIVFTSFMNLRFLLTTTTDSLFDGVFIFCYPDWHIIIGFQSMVQKTTIAETTTGTKRRTNYKLA